MDLISSVIVISQLMLSVYLGPKVITLSSLLFSVKLKVKLIDDVLKRRGGCSTQLILTIEIEEVLFDNYKKLGCLNRIKFDKIRPTNGVKQNIIHTKSN